MFLWQLGSGVQLTDVLQATEGAQPPGAYGRGHSATNITLLARCDYGEEADRELDRAGVFGSGG